jgi:hypothetical protein
MMAKREGACLGWAFDILFFDNLEMRIQIMDSLYYTFEVEKELRNGARGAKYRVGSGFEDKTSEVAVVVHEEVGAGLHTDVVGIAFSDDDVPGGSVAFVEDFLDGFCGQLGHVGEGDVCFDAVDDCV